jgi:uncharacterized ferredoxin-like protein
MMLEQDIREAELLEVARAMVVAARTAPKGKGIDNLFACIIPRAEITSLHEKMHQLFEQTQAPVFKINGDDILKAECIVVLGARDMPLGLKKCGFCGFADCSEKEQSGTGRCAISMNDLGIAIGSAVAVAADRRVDTRIMYSIGYAMLHSGMLPADVVVAHGIPLSASSKNPFFDRVFT